MTDSVPSGQTDVDDWFDLDRYREAAGVAYEFSKKRWRMLVNKSERQLKKEPQSSASPKPRKKHATIDKQDKRISSDVFEFFVDNLDSSTKETFCRLRQISTP